jgi:hypothetical protein
VPLKSGTCIGIIFGVQGVAIAPPLYFICKNSSSGYAVEERQIENRNIKKKLFGWCTDRKNEINQSYSLSQLESFVN